MKNIRLFLLGILLLSQWAFAQNREGRASSSFSVNLIGHTPTIGLNYDQLVLRKEQFNLGFRLGLPLVNPYSNYFFFEKSGKGISGGINALYGRRNAHLELSLNSGLYTDTRNSFHPVPVGLGIISSVYSGFRYQRPGGGLFFKAGLAASKMSYHPDEWSATTSLWPLLEVGLTIPNGYQHPLVQKAAAERLKKREAREAFVPEFNLIVLAGAEFAGFDDRGNYRFAGQAGGKSASLEPSYVSTAFLPSVQLEWRPARHFALVGGPEFRREKMEVNWQAQSWLMSIDDETYYATGNMDLTVNSLRVPVYAKFVFGGRFEASGLLGPTFNFRLSYLAEGRGETHIDAQSPAYFDIENSSLNELPVIEAGLLPAPVRMGVSLGFEGRYRLTHRHNLLFRAMTGTEISRQFYFPGFSMIWANAQVGYGLSLK